MPVLDKADKAKCEEYEAFVRFSLVERCSVPEKGNIHHYLSINCTTWKQYCQTSLCKKCSLPGFCGIFHKNRMRTGKVCLEKIGKAGRRCAIIIEYERRRFMVPVMPTPKEDKRCVQAISGLICPKN